MPDAMARVRRTLGLLSAAALTAACSGGDKIVSSTGTPGGGTPTVIAADDSALLANLVSSQAVSSFKNLRLMQITNVAALIGGSLPTGCNPTLAGSGDTNGNGIAEDQSLTFTAQNCALSQQGTTVRLTGSVRIQDIGGLRGYRLTYSNLTQTVTVADTTASLEANGAFEAQWTSTTAGRTSSTLSTKITLGVQGGSASISFGANVNSQFATSGGTIAVGRNLPAGTYTLSGTLTVSLTASGSFRTAGVPATATFNTAISTTTTMSYDGTCTHDRAFRTGEMRGVVTGYAPGNVTTSFNGCGSGVTLPPGVKR